MAQCFLKIYLIEPNSILLPKKWRVPPLAPPPTPCSPSLRKRRPKSTSIAPFQLHRLQLLRACSPELQRPALDFPRGTCTVAPLIGVVASAPKPVSLLSGRSKTTTVQTRVTPLLEPWSSSIWRPSFSTAQLLYQLTIDQCADQLPVTRIETHKSY